MRYNQVITDDLSISIGEANRAYANNYSRRRTKSE